MKPILFSTPMVREILGGHKSMTRRVIVLPKWSSRDYNDFEYEDGELQTICESTGCFARIKPKYNVGDILWVRETWTYLGADKENDPCFGYKAGSPHLQNNMYIKWKPSIFMPKAVARIFLRVTEVRAERLQYITEEDAIREGVMGLVDKVLQGLTGKTRFQRLWDSLNKKRGYGWDTNPWVWVYSFERIGAEEAQKEEKA